MTLVIAILILLNVTVYAAKAQGHGYRAWPMPKTWRATSHPVWFRQAMCIHSHEGAWNAVGYVNGRATYGGGMQFLLSTWHRAGGTASSVYDIARQTPREQLYRAWIIVRSHGGSWSEWGTASRCGLR